MNFHVLKILVGIKLLVGTRHFLIRLLAVASILNLPTNAFSILFCFLIQMCIYQNCGTRRMTNLGQTSPTILKLLKNLQDIGAPKIAGALGAPRPKFANVLMVCVRPFILDQNRYHHRSTSFRLVCDLDEEVGRK